MAEQHGHGLDHSRDPCPWVALSDFGGAFCMGAIGGALWHGIKGYRNSPYGERRIGGIHSHPSPTTTTPSSNTYASPQQSQR
jgi:import inner membrane translocase subunit TIM17